MTRAHREHHKVIVNHCISVMISRDESVFRHSMNVLMIARKITNKLGINGDMGYCIDIGSQLHDYGKISIPKEVLGKTTLFSKEEFTLIQRHPTTGLIEIDAASNALTGPHSKLPCMVTDIIVSHHERNGGHGYPNGIKSLPLPVEIVAAADVLAGIQEHRSYRNGIGIKETINLVLREQWSEPIRKILTEHPEMLELSENRKNVLRNQPELISMER